MATQKSTDYLRWNAASIKDLITEKLNEDGVYSDQIFPGSDLSVTIDVFAYMYDTLTYYLNHGATEAIFNDAQLYENMNRIVKMLGYNPKGFITSTIGAILGLKESSQRSGYRTTIPKYTTFTTSASDGLGNPIRYTFTKPHPVHLSTEKTVSSIFKPTLYNGSWKSYPITFITEGIPFETFTLDQVHLDGDNKVYVADKFIDCLVENENGKFEMYQAVSNLYNSTATDLHFEARVNENKVYTLKFGDNINGKRLLPNSKIYVIYMESNGPDGQIGSNGLTIDNVAIVDIEGLSEAFIKYNILKVDMDSSLISFGDPNIGYTDISETQLQYLTANNPEASSTVQDLENVTQIRQNAPDWFRMGSRLITTQDFRQYILSVYSYKVYDIKVMNNWEYMIEFQEWLRSYDKLKIDIRNYSYYFSDSCDFNNIYLWVKSLGSEILTDTFKSKMERDCDRLKPVTSEVIFLDPFMVELVPYLKGKSDYQLTNWDPTYENTIQVVRDRNSMITVERIQQKSVEIIKSFFELSNQKLGNTININDLYNQLMAIDGVKKIRTRYLKNGEPESSAEYFDGLSFALWTQHILQGADFTMISGNYKIKSFQFPRIYDVNTLTNRVQVLSDSYNISEVEY